MASSVVLVWSPKKSIAADLLAGVIQGLSKESVCASQLVVEAWRPAARQEQARAATVGACRHDGQSHKHHPSPSCSRACNSEL